MIGVRCCFSNPNICAMSMIIKMFLLKIYRKKKGVALSDMAAIIGMDNGNLSRIERGYASPSLDVIIAYHLLLQIPYEDLFQKNFINILSRCLHNARRLRDTLLDQLSTPEPTQQIVTLDEMIDRLHDILESYEK
jgi:transcriptional regulator with XRE-family HTH domain